MPVLDEVVGARTLFREIYGGSMICDQDPLRRRLRKSTARYKTMRGVCLDDEKLVQMGFQSRADPQNHAIGWLQGDIIPCWWDGGTISTNLDVIWGMSVESI